jgi:hypothetical protein
MKFLLCTEFIDKIQKILHKYKILINNKCCVDDIKLLISNWNRSSIPVEIKKNMKDMNWETLKSKDATCDSIETFNDIYIKKFLFNKCMYLVQDLIDVYTLNCDITKTALENLLPVMELLAKIDSLKFLSPRRLTFMNKITYIALFIRRNIKSIIYRETYFAYLKGKMNRKLLKVYDKHSDINGNYYTLINSTLTTTATDSIHNSKFVVTTALDTSNKTTKLFSDIQDLVLSQHHHVTNLVDINSLRAVNMDLYGHYNVVQVTKIATENLKSIINSIFMLNSMEFIKLLEQCGAIVSGSTTEQSIHGASIEVESGLDLYVPLDKVDSSRCLLELIYNAGYTKVEEVPPVVSSDTHYLPRNLSYRFSHIILDVTTLKHRSSGKKIQVTTIENTDGMTTSEFGHFVISSFDFTFLKNFYDGTTLYIDDFYGVVKKHGSISPYVAQKLDLNRHPKIKALFPVQFWYAATMATLIRVIKYQSRGYHIDNIPQFSLVKQLNL